MIALASYSLPSLPYVQFMSLCPAFSYSALPCLGTMKKWRRRVKKIPTLALHFQIASCAIGLLPFIMYTADLISVTESHGLSLSPQMYADDRQVYGSCRPAAVDALSSKISECVGAVASWMESNRLSLNCDKTEVVWYGADKSTTTPASVFSSVS